MIFRPKKPKSKSKHPQDNGFACNCLPDLPWNYHNASREVISFANQNKVVQRYFQNLNNLKNMSLNKRPELSSMIYIAWFWEEQNDIQVL